MSFAVASLSNQGVRVSSSVFPFILYICLTTALVLAGNSGLLTWVRHSSRKSSATHAYRCVQHLRVFKQWYGCQCLGFLTCAQMLTHAIAQGGCADAVRESALKADSGRKMYCRTGDSNQCQYCVWLSSRTLYQTANPALD